MKFSILIPVYNVKNYLDECVISVLNQTYNNYEIIIIDDGSNDGSEKICDKYKSDNVKVIHKNNEGLLLARSEAIKHAESDYCVFLDSDDTLASDCLERINNSIKKFGNVDLIIYNLNNWYPAKDEYTPREVVYNEECLLKGNEINELKELFITTSSLNNLVIKAVKTSILKSDERDYTNRMFTDYGEDAIRSYHIFDTSKSIVYLPYALYNYRQNENSITRSFYSFNSIKEKVGIGTELLKIEYMKKWKIDTNSNIERVSVNRLESLRVIFSTNYMQISQHRQRVRYVSEEWGSLIGNNNFKYINSKMIPRSHRIEIKALLNRCNIVLEIIRLIRLLRMSQ